MSALEEPHAPPKRSRNQYAKRADASPAAEGATPANSGRNTDGTFAKGNSANLAGKPKGALNHATRAILAMMQGEAEAITRKAIDLALAGDSVAMRLVMERLVSPVRERPVNVAMPKIGAASDLIAAAAALTDATAAGDITPGEAAALSMLVGNVAKAIETVEIVARLAKLEEHLLAKGNNP
jgi:Family of unknown function (DUF5681)